MTTFLVGLVLGFLVLVTLVVIAVALPTRRTR